MLLSAPRIAVLPKTAMSKCLHHEGTERPCQRQPSSSAHFFCPHYFQLPAGCTSGGAGMIMLAPPWVVSIYLTNSS